MAAIVQAVPGSTVAAERAITRVGGHIVRRLGIINGYSAKIPAAEIDQLRTAPGVAGVSLDRTR